MRNEKPKKLIEIKQPIQLLVEGKDDADFLYHFKKHLDLPNIQIQRLEGNGNLQSFLLSFLNARNFEIVKSIGVVIDADENKEQEWKRVKSALEKRKLPVPDSIGQKSNNEPTGGKPTTSVFIMPGSEENNGMLETLLCKSLTEPINNCINDFFQCMRGLPEHPIIKRQDKACAHAYIATCLMLDEARARAYIATRPDPRVSVGIAAEKGYWNLDHPAFTELKAFLENLTPNK